MFIAASFCFFLILMIGVGVAASWKKSGSADDYLTAGRSHGRFTIALSGAASATSGFIMIGAVGAGYSLGLMAVLIPLSWFLGDVLFWTLFPSKLNRMGRDSNCSTVPELISYTASGQADAPLRKFFATIVIVFIGLYAVGQFLAAGKAVNAVFDLPMQSAIFLSAGIILVYSAKGGLQSSIPTQFVQALIMLFTTLGMFAIALWFAGGPVQLIVDLQADRPELLYLDGGRGLQLLLAFMLGFAVQAFTFDVGQPNLLVRILAAKSPEEARKARWIYLGFMQATWVSMSLFGLMMVVLLPELSDPEQALPIFAEANLHPILAGAVLAGLFAAVASTLDGMLLVLSSAIGVDLVPKLYQRMTKKYGVGYQSVVTLVVTIMIALLSTLVIGGTSVFNLIVFSSAGLGVTIGCAILIALTRWQTSPMALTVSALVALAVTATWRYLGYSEVMVEALPGFIAGILTHAIYIRLLGR